MSLIIITTTSDDREELEHIAMQLVESKLAACCQIGGPITSVYTWNGTTEKATEWTCTIKTQKQRFGEVQAMIQQLHHYDIPQIVAVDACNSSAKYRIWVNHQTNPRSAPD